MVLSQPPAASRQEAWTEKDQQITVTEGNGFLYNLQLRAKIAGRPEDVYEVLTDPESVTIFRNIKDCTYRDVIHDNGRGERMLAVGHRAIARFLFINFTFETHLHVWEDDRNKTVRFQVARDGVMKKFDGQWTLQPFTSEVLHGIHHPDTPLQNQHRNLLSTANIFTFLHHKPAPAETLVTLEQHILPKGPAPPGIRGLICKLCAKQIKDMMQDLQTELEKRKNGTSAIVARRQSCCHSSSGQVTKPAANARSTTTAASVTTALGPAALWTATLPMTVTFSL